MFILAGSRHTDSIKEKKTFFIHGRTLKQTFVAFGTKMFTNSCPNKEFSIICRRICIYNSDNHFSISFLVNIFLYPSHHEYVKATFPLCKSQSSVRSATGTLWYEWNECTQPAHFPDIHRKAFL